MFRLTTIIGAVSLLAGVVLVASGCGDDATSNDGDTREAMLTWTAPTTYTDGSPLDSVGGYLVYVAASSQVDASSQSIDVTDDAVCTMVGGSGEQCETTLADHFSDGEYCFAVTAYDGTLVESEFSNQACKTF